jgi:hypothetical protein
MRELIHAKQKDKQFRNPLDPLLLRLSKDYIDETDLSARLQELFKVPQSLLSQRHGASLRRSPLKPLFSDSAAVTWPETGRQDLLVCSNSGDHFAALTVLNKFLLACAGKPSLCMI